MRSTRVFLLLAIFAILGGVGATYYRQKKDQARHALPAPKVLPVEVNAAASDWVWSNTVGGRPIVEVRAKDFRQVKDRVDLQRVELRIYHQDAKEFDRVKSARAEFDMTQGTLYSDGDVEITMGLPAAGGPSGRLVLIRTSGATFDSKTGRASTERLATFLFDQGDGKAVGASYDPNSRELHMNSQVELNWRGQGPKFKPMKIEAGELLYKEREAVVFLFPWSRLTRENTVLDAANAVVKLQDGAIQRAEAANARGTDRYPNRELEYAADQLAMDFTPDSEIERITGLRNARLVSTSDTTRTTMTSNRVQLDFDLSTGESALKVAQAMGKSCLEAVPLSRPGVQMPMTRTLRSEVIFLHMRPGGREIDSVETHTPGHLEFLPNRPGQRKRSLDGERLSIKYGPNNQAESFRSVNVTTRTEPEPRKGKEPEPAIETASKEFSAEFAPKTGQLARLEQWNDFRYQEGDRRGRAERAVLEEARNLITLERSARVWDPSGATSADRILLDQKSGDVTAEGNVISTRLPDKKGSSSAMLSHDDPMEAKADRMLTTNRNQKIVYEGKAVAWQGPNRIRADRIAIDRQARRLEAQGNVRTQFVDRAAQGSPQAKSKAAPTFVLVESAALVYTEENRLAHYSGGSHLSKPGMDVKAAEIRAFLSDSSADSSLDHAFADGKVEIVQRAPDRTRKGTSEHAEYYASEAKIVLEKGQPAFVDSLRGYTQGQQLTYFINDDKLLVNGSEKQPVISRIRRQPERIRMNRQ